MANTTNESRKQEPRSKEKRMTRPAREDGPQRGPTSEQRDRDEDAPQPPMTGGHDDEG